MALTDQQKSFLQVFFQEQFNTQGSGFATWLVDFFLSGSAAQKSAVLSWLTDRQKRNSDEITTTLDAHVIVAKSALSSENAFIDALKISL